MLGINCELITKLKRKTAQTFIRKYQSSEKCQITVMDLNIMQVYEPPGLSPQNCHETLQWVMYHGSQNSYSAIYMIFCPILLCFITSNVIILTMVNNANKIAMTLWQRFENETWSALRLCRFLSSPLSA